MPRTSPTSTHAAASSRASPPRGSGPRARCRGRGPATASATRISTTPTRRPSPASSPSFSTVTERSLAMLTRHVALVSEQSKITMRELSAVAAALQKQATRDLGPIWQVEATVTSFERLEDLPLDYWPVIVKDDIGDPNAAGYHEDENGQPFSPVQYSRGWPLTASHEVLEMLVDPFGRRLVAGTSPVRGEGRLRFLVEVCDPSEAGQNSDQ